MADMDPRTGRLASLTIRCACGYSVTWPSSVIVARLGSSMRPSALRRGVRCTACGAKGPPKVQIIGSTR